MCGIAGIYYLNGTAKTGEIRRMTDSLRHRGPDDEGFLGVDFERRKAYPLMGKESRGDGPRVEDFEQPVHLMLGHRRLSIIDLSPAGHQPMGNEDGSLWVVHNGEIYNYLEIRKELERLGHTFRSKTDTEVILHAYEEWGIDCLARFNGMWAFAIVDCGKKQIFCSRDRAGVKPFYYVYDGKRFLFASEIKALLVLEGMVRRPNDRVIADYLFSGFADHTRETFFEGITQLLPGEYLLIENNRMVTQSYWDIEPKKNYYNRESEYGERFYELFEDSVRLRLRSDVPIGSCLSGGVDSSSIVCLANRLMFSHEGADLGRVGERQKTFSSCFEDPSYDERRHIEVVIQRTGAEKHYTFPNPEDLIQKIDRLTWHQDEPFGSTSFYAQWMVMELAKEHGVTVLLDGQGADELLAGYLPSFFYLFRQTLRESAFLRLIKEMVNFRTNHGEAVRPFIRKMLTAMIPNWNLPMISKSGKERLGWAEEGFQKRYFRTFPMAAYFENDLDNYLYQLFRSTALPRLLHCEDRNSMAFSLEARLPFLDYRLIEYIFSLPLEQKIGKGMTKVVLRNSMKGVLPETVRNRTDKMGFSTPMNFWLKEALQGWILRVLESKAFAQRGYFDVSKVKGVFAEHCAGRRDHSSAIWRWVNLELWFRTFIDRRPSLQIQ
jgi:asparagine synthase (glutamine-hydrolysing)